MYSFASLNSKSQGDIGVGAAIGYFSSLGWKVLIPLSDNQPYDLVIDDGVALKKVQVKTSKHKDRYDKYVVTLSTSGGNKTGTKVKKFDNSVVDLLFILLEDGKRYLIPANYVEAKRAIQMGEGYKEFLVEGRS